MTQHDDAGGGKSAHQSRVDHDIQLGDVLKGPVEHLHQAVDELPHHHGALQRTRNHLHRLQATKTVTYSM